jgi:hypothetical protein
MKTKLLTIGIALTGLIFTSCSTGAYMSKSSVTPTDDIYYSPGKTITTPVAVNNTNSDTRFQKQDTSALKIAALEQKYLKKIGTDSTKIDTLINQDLNSNPYDRVLSDSYQDSYERRIKGMQDPMYGMEDRYSLYSNDDYRYASTYDPAVYHLVVMGDQVWVEPWYISAMFSTRLPGNFWFGFNYGWNPWYSYDYYSSYYMNDYYLYSFWNPFNTFPYYGGGYPGFSGGGYYYPYPYNPQPSNNHDFYGRRHQNSTNITSTDRHTGLSFEDRIKLSHRGNGISTQTGTNNNIRTRNTNQTNITNRNTQDNKIQDPINRGRNRNTDIITTRLRGNETSRNGNVSMTEPTRRNNNNTFQKPRSTNNDEYNKTGTRNQNTNTGTTTRDINTKNTPSTRDNRNATPTYNRPNRVDASSTRERPATSERETYTRPSGGTSGTGSGSSTHSNSGGNSGGSSTVNSGSTHSSPAGNTERKR